MKYSFSEVHASRKNKDAWWTILVADKIAIPLTYLVANFTKLTPNSITILSLLLALFSAYLFSFGSYKFLFYGAVVFQLSFLLDCVDGKLARLTDQETNLGKRLEFIRDKTAHTLNLIAIAYGSYLLSQNSQVIFISLIYFVLLSFYWFLYRSPYSKKYSNNHLLPTSVETTIIIFLFAPLFNRIIEGLTIGSLLLFILLLYRFREILL